MTKTRIYILIFTMLTIAVPLATADLEFIGPDITADDRLLFTARVDIPGEDGYDTLFAGDPESGNWSSSPSIRSRLPYWMMAAGFRFATVSGSS
jgi:hypothetical protein